MPFEKGNKFSPGGKPGNKGGGRDPNWLREKCRQIVERDKLVEFLGDVAAGRVSDHKVIDGEVVKIPASIYDRRECALALLDRGFGKPAQIMASIDENGKWIPYSLQVQIDPTLIGSNGHGENGNGKNSEHKPIA